jgi:CRP-like cAMP-binding protein
MRKATMALAPDPSVLRGAEMFATLNDAQLADVIHAGHVRSLHKGERVFAQGDPGTTCHSLLHGRVKIVQTRPDGVQHVLRFIGPGEMYGTVAAMMGKPFPADAVAVTDSVEVFWTVETLRDLMGRIPEIAQQSIKSAGERLMELQSRLGELTAERVEQRVARALVRLVRQAGRRTDEGVEIDFPLTRQDLANMSGSTLFTVSRILSGWEEEGIVAGQRRKIVVLKPHALVAMAEDLHDTPKEH